MAPFYAEMCAEFNQTPDEKLLEELKKKNTSVLAEKEKKISEAEEMEGLTILTNLEIKNFSK